MMMMIKYLQIQRSTTFHEFFPILLINLSETENFEQDLKYLIL